MPRLPIATQKTIPRIRRIEPTMMAASAGVFLRPTLLDCTLPMMPRMMPMSWVKGTIASTRPAIPRPLPGYESPAG